MKTEAEARPKALLVEGDPVAHDLLLDQLQQAGLDVAGLFTLHEAIRLIEAGYRPSVAVIDSTLPDGDGAEVCRLLKQLPEGHLIPCLLHSSAANLDELAKEAGADAWLGAPLELPQFRTELNSLLERAQTSRDV